MVNAQTTQKTTLWLALAFFILAFSLQPSAFAFSLRWLPSPTPDIIGYRIYASDQAPLSVQPIGCDENITNRWLRTTRLVGWSTEPCFALSNSAFSLQPSAFPNAWFAVTAVDTNLVESDPSNILPMQFAYVRVWLESCRELGQPWLPVVQPEEHIISFTTNSFFRSRLEFSRNTNH